MSKGSSSGRGGLDDPANHDINDNPHASTVQSGLDDPANHDLNDNRGGVPGADDPENHDLNDIRHASSVQSGLDDPANHDANDDRGGVPGADDPAGHDLNDNDALMNSNPGPGDQDNVPVAGETLTGTAGADRLRGGDGDDSISGLGGNDRLEGDKGNDTIDGGAGNDLIRGGHGADVLTGGPGADTFVIDSGANALSDIDRITDFTHGVDKLVFDDAPMATTAGFATDTAADFNTALADANAKMAAGADFVAVQVGADVIVFADEVGEHHVESAVLLVGKTLADISSSDIGA